MLYFITVCLHCHQRHIHYTSDELRYWNLLGRFFKERIKIKKNIIATKLLYL